MGAGLFWHTASFFGVIFSFLFVYRRQRRLHKRIDEMAKMQELLEEEMKGILANISEGVVTLDEDMRITMMNDRAKELFSIDRIPFEMGKFYDFYESGNLILWKSAANLLRRVEKESVNGTETLQLGDGKVHLEMQGRVLGGKRGYVLLICDCSNHQKMLDMGKEFISNASHELRTPVTIIKGFAETLRDIPEISDIMLESILEKIMRNCERMENLVKHLLQLTDLDQATLSNAYECEATSLIEDCCRSVLNLYPNVRIEQLCSSDEMFIFADPDLIELAVTNILKNSVKYSDKDAFIQVRMQEKKGRLYIQITDKGVGIPEDSLERIFERFYTVDKARCRKLGGAGLGLSIVKLIIEKHEGKIWATSELGEGTTFHLSLPLLHEKARSMPELVALP